MNTRRQGRVGTALMGFFLAGALLAAPASATAADGELDYRVELYQNQQAIARLIEKYKDGAFTAPDYRKQRIALEQTGDALDASLSDLLQPAQDGGDASLTARLSEARRKRAENARAQKRTQADYKSGALSAREATTRLLDLLKADNGLKAAEDQVLWEITAHGTVARAGNEQDARDLAFERSTLEDERRALDYGRAQGTLSADAYRAGTAELDRRESDLDKRGAVLQNKTALDSKTPAVGERDYNSYLEARRRLGGIEDERETLTEQLEKGLLTSIEYQERKSALALEEEELERFLEQYTPILGNGNGSYDWRHTYTW